MREIARRRVCANGYCQHAEGDPDCQEVEGRQVLAARAWLDAAAARARGWCTSEDSYTLKHIVEEWSQQYCDASQHYIANGAFIVAARKEGYRDRPCGFGSMNAVFNIKPRPVF
jgi:hypothetical protein